MFIDHRGITHNVKGPFIPIEIFISESKKNVFRGMHLSPYAKFIYIIKGVIRDFVWDGTLKDVTLLQGQSLFIPADAAHGFFAVEEAIVIYLLEGSFDPLKDKNIFWQNPEYGIPFFKDAILSEKDETSYKKM
jgi:dTDP-4-dehydrorhamnose 3,5-epimerase-like enzyme